MHSVLGSPPGQTSQHQACQQEASGLSGCKVLRPPWTPTGVRSWDKGAATITLGKQGSDVCHVAHELRNSLDPSPGLRLVSRPPRHALLSMVVGFHLLSCFARTEARKAHLRLLPYLNGLCVGSASSPWSFFKKLCLLSPWHGPRLVLLRSLSRSADAVASYGCVGNLWFCRFHGAVPPRSLQHGSNSRLRAKNKLARHFI